MKSTGIVRKIDDLGRLVLPKETRRVMSLDIKDPVEIYTDGDAIILKKYQPGCRLCSSMEDILQVGETRICRACADKIADAARKGI